MIYKTYKHVHNINLHSQSNPAFFTTSFEPLTRSVYIIEVSVLGWSGEQNIFMS